MLQEKSYGSVKIISIRRKELLERLGEIARQVRQGHPEVAELRLWRESLPL